MLIYLAGNPGAQNRIDAQRKCGRHRLLSFWEIDQELFNSDTEFVQRAEAIRHADLPSGQCGARVASVELGKPHEEPAHQLRAPGRGRVEGVALQEGREARGPALMGGGV